MSRLEKFLIKVLRGTSDANIDFDTLCTLLRSLDFSERVRGSHHIFTKEGVKDIINIQPNGSKAKVYQVKQIRRIILKYGLGGNGG